MITFNKQSILNALATRINECLDAPAGQIYLQLDKPEAHVFEEYMRTINIDSYFSVPAYNAMLSAFKKISEDNMQEELSVACLQSCDGLELNQIVKALVGHDNSPIVDLMIHVIIERGL